MAKIRGIGIKIVSQFDMKRLPELCPISSLGCAKNIAACYIPIYPGSQIWFEYSIDGPHPPNASYFFKLLLNDKLITSWDCTARYGHRGKTIYALQPMRDEFSDSLEVKRHAFRFSTDDRATEPTPQDDCIEIRVYRIEHRQRVQLPEEIPTISRGDTSSLQLIDGGLILPGHRLPRRYRYQLLDAHDEPYAIIRFYYRTYEYLERHQISSIAPALSIASPTRPAISAYDETDMMQIRTHNEEKASSSPLNRKWTSNTRQNANEYFHTISVSNTSLYSLAKDSIEDLTSSVPRSPRSKFYYHRSAQSVLPVATTVDISASPKSLTPPITPTKPVCSPRRFCRKKTNHNQEDHHDKSAGDKEPPKRPLSPFNGSGVLRRLMGPLPPAANPVAKGHRYGWSLLHRSAK